MPACQRAFLPSCFRAAPSKQPNLPRNLTTIDSQASPSFPKPAQQIHEDMEQAKPSTQPTRVTRPVRLSIRTTTVLLAMVVGGYIPFYFARLYIVPVTGRHRYFYFRKEEELNEAHDTHYSAFRKKKQRSGRLLADSYIRAQAVARVMKRLLAGVADVTGAVLNRSNGTLASLRFPRDQVGFD